MTYTPRTFTKGAETRVAETALEDIELLWDGWTPGTPYVTPRTALPAHLSDLDALSVTQVGPLAVPKADLTFASTGSTAVPFSVGTDGKVYAAESWRSGRAVRTNNGFGSVENGPDFVALGSAQPFLVYLGRVAEGYVAVLSNGTTTLNGGAEVWFSNSWSTGWTKRQNTGTVGGISIGEPRLDPETGGTVWVIGEYSQTVGGLHHVWVSRDGGQSWTDRGAITADDASRNNHVHGVCFDPVTRRVYVSRGDGPNAWYGYSSDFGATWTPVPGAGIKPLDDPLYHQPVLNFPMPAGIVNNADGSAGFAGIWTTDRVSHYSTQSLRVDQNVAGGANQYAEHPVARTATTAYALVPMRGTRVSMKWYVVGTGDGGRSWRRVYQSAQAADEYLDHGIVGPDPAGRVYVHKRTGTLNTTTASTLLFAQVAEWVPIPASPPRGVGGDVIASLVQAGIVDPSVAPTIDLAGGRLTAGHGTFNATLATITLGDGTNYGAVTTKAGTVNLRIGAENVTTLTVSSAGVDIADGKYFKAGTGTGTMIGTQATQKFGFYGATPVARPTGTPAAASDAATTQTLVNDLRAKLITLGLIG